MFGIVSKWKKLYLSAREETRKLIDIVSSKDRHIDYLQSKIDRLESDLLEAMNDLANTPPEVQVIKEVQVTIPPERFDKFVAGLPNAQVGNDSSAGALGHKLGVSMVLDKMRREFVV